MQMRKTPSCEQCCPKEDRGGGLGGDSSGWNFQIVPLKRKKPLGSGGYYTAAAKTGGDTGPCLPT